MFLQGKPHARHHEAQSQEGEGGAADRLSALPDEILLHLFAMLDPLNLCHASTLNKRFHSITEDERLWKALYLRYFSDGSSPPLQSPKVEGLTTWKDVLKEYSYRDGPVKFPREMDLSNLYREPLKIVIMGSGGVGKVVPSPTSFPSSGSFLPSIDQTAIITQFAQGKIIEVYGIPAM